MAENKTRATGRSVDRFLDGIKDDRRRRDCITLAGWMESITKEKPVMWGSSIVGFGRYHYRYASGREGDSFLAGFSPRKQNLTLYLMGGLEPNADLLAKLGKYKTGVGCLYIKSLDDVHAPTLKQLIRRTVVQLRRMYP